MRRNGNQRERQRCGTETPKGGERKGAVRANVRGSAAVLKRSKSKHHQNDGREPAEEESDRKQTENSASDPTGASQTGKDERQKGPGQNCAREEHRLPEDFVRLRNTGGLERGTFSERYVWARQGSVIVGLYVLRGKKELRRHEAKEKEKCTDSAVRRERFFKWRKTKASTTSQARVKKEDSKRRSAKEAGVRGREAGGRRKKKRERSRVGRRA